jgi:hypothetical protein
MCRVAEGVVMVVVNETVVGADEVELALERVAVVLQKGKRSQPS